MPPSEENISVTPAGTACAKAGEKITESSRETDCRERAPAAAAALRCAARRKPTIVCPACGSALIRQSFHAGAVDGYRHASLVRRFTPHFTRRLTRHGARTPPPA